MLPLVTKSVATADVMAVLDGVSAKLTTDNLKEMMVKVVNDKQAPDVVAKDFVATSVASRQLDAALTAASSR